MTDDHVNRIEDDGTRSVPDPDPVYVARLGAYLDAEWRPRRPTSPARVRAVPWIAAAAACLVAFLVGLAVGDDGTQVELVTAGEATDAFTANPLSTTPLARGDRLPDGTVIRTGPDGRVVIGEGVMGPNQTGVIEDGRLHVVDDPATTVSSNPPDAGAPTTTQRSTTTTTTTAPARSATGEDATGPETQELFLYVGHRREFVLAAWSEFDGEFSHYLLLRSAAGSPPTWPATGDTTIVARVDRGGDRGATEMVDDPAGVRYRVVAVDDRGDVVAQSSVVTPRDLETESRSTGNDT